MTGQNFIRKNLKDYVQAIGAKDIIFNKPQLCPHCGINTDAPMEKYNMVSYSEADNTQLIVFIWRCTVCEKVFVSLHTLNKDVVEYVGTYPQKLSLFNDAQLEEVSPRFIEVYNQALRAELTSDYNLAAIGFRTALEILTKDFAIAYSGDTKEQIVKLTLCDTIKKYFGESAVFSSANAIRILGNDHTHYERKYPEYDFSWLKECMAIVIALVRAELLKKNPPDSFQPKN